MKKFRDNYYYIPKIYLVDKFIYQNGKFQMNNKIFNHIVEKMKDTFHLAKYDEIRTAFGADTDLEELPWTPARKLKFQQELAATFNVPVELEGSVADLVDRTDRRYLSWFFGEIWKPRTEKYHWTGYRIAEEICRMNPRRVLDVGCGYNPFKGRIPNLTGIDPYNNCADFHGRYFRLSCRACQL
jgi:hypothetical protein